MATAELQTSLAQFAAFARSLKGDEKSEAQLFLDKFFRALGHGGVQEAGATLEFRIAKKPGSAQLELVVAGPSDPGLAVAGVFDPGLVVAGVFDPGRRPKGGKKFADLLWPDRVLIEMKSRGTNLEKHYDQAFEYWTHIVPKRPPYVILCNFDEFWIYDFNTQLFDPVDRIDLRDLVTSSSAFSFLLPAPVRPIFENNRVDVTRRAADVFAGVFKDVVFRREDRARAQRFILQLLVAVVAEDIGLLPADLVTGLLGECTERPAESYDLLGGLFRQMASKAKARGGRYAGVEYFNGGLFEVVDPIELRSAEAYALRDAARHNDWSKVKPEIFGTLFQQSMDAKERHAFGAHFTSEFDIQKVVGPTIVRPWRERIDAAGRSVSKLRETLADLRRFRVLDPACGSGNFLFVAYREMKRLERDLLVRLRDVSKAEPLESAISLHQFHGIDNQPFAVELAKVTLMLAKELELIEAKKLAETDQLLIEENPLPLDNLDSNIRCADSLFTEWPKADAIIGNPPYLGAKLLKPTYGTDYVKKVRTAFPDIPGMADLCVYWFRKAHDALPLCTEDHRCSGRAGLVGTQNIRNNQSRVGGLDYIVKTGTILEAVDNQPWSGEANVHVSIVNWTKTHDPNLLPSRRTLWTEAGPVLGAKPRGKEALDDKLPHVKRIALACRRPAHINSSLSDDVDVSSKASLSCNKSPKRCFQGKIPGYDGFMLDGITADRLRQDSSDVIVPYLTGRELLSEFKIDRWAIDFRDMNMLEASARPSAFEHCKTHVLPEVQRSCREAERNESDMLSARREHLDRWWQFWNRRDELNSMLDTVRRYIACSRVTRRPVMTFLASDICPSDLIQVFAFDDDYSFGVLQSSLHFEWFRKSSRLKVETDLRYSVRDVFDTFPWPQESTLKQVVAIAQTARQLRSLRFEASRNVNGGLRGLYRLLELPGSNPLKDAHTALDQAVFSAYGFSESDDPLANLLSLNRTIFERVEHDEPVTAPGLPPHFSDQPTLRSDDCMRP